MLTKSEKQIMDLLWSVNEPLSCTEIVELSGEKTWKDSYVHSLIKSLMKKDMVEIAAFELISRSYARKFKPKLNKEQYYLREYLSENPDNSFIKLFASFAETADDPKQREQIEGIIKEWKKSHNV